MATFGTVTQSGGQADWSLPLIDLCSQTENVVVQIPNHEVPATLYASDMTVKVSEQAVVIGISVVLLAAVLGATETITMQLHEDGVLIGDAKSVVSGGLIGFGSNGDTWGVTGLTASRINASTFGVAIDSTATSTGEVDLNKLAITVYTFLSGGYGGFSGGSGVQGKAIGRRQKAMKASKSLEPMTGNSNYSVFGKTINLNEWYK